MVPWYFQQIRKNKPYTFKDMLLQPENPNFILAMIKDVREYEARSHWTLMKKDEFNISTKINMRSSRIFYPFGILIVRDYHMEE